MTFSAAGSRQWLLPQQVLSRYCTLWLMEPWSSVLELWVGISMHKADCGTATFRQPLPMPATCEVEPLRTFMFR